jgi:hypothetical protein
MKLARSRWSDDDFHREKARHADRIKALKAELEAAKALRAELDDAGSAPVANSLLPGNRVSSTHPVREVAIHEEKLKSLQAQLDMANAAAAKALETIPKPFSSAVSLLASNRSNRVGPSGLHGATSATHTEPPRDPTNVVEEVQFSQIKRLPVAVICVEFGNEMPHVEEFVEYHSTVGFSHIYASDGGITDDSRKALESFPDSLVTVLPRANTSAGHHNTAQCLKHIASDNAIVGPHRAGQHVWVFGIDADEYVSPFRPEKTVPEVLASYERAGKLHLDLRKVWFGGGWTPEAEECGDGPLLARFVRYGTQRQATEAKHVRVQGVNTNHNRPKGGGKPAFSTRTLPHLQKYDQWKRVSGTPLSFTHHIKGLKQRSKQADADGDDGLVLLHYKPQSLHEYRRRAAWNLHFDKYKPSDKRQEDKDESSTIDNTWTWMHNQTNGATHASMLLRVPALCREHPRFARSLNVCGMQDLCQDCHQLQVQHGCADGTLVSTSTHAKAKASSVDQVFVLGASDRVISDAIHTAGLDAVVLSTPDQGQALNSSVPVILADPQDRAAICSARCERALFVAPALLRDSATIASMVRVWLGSREWPEAFDAGRNKP